NRSGSAKWDFAFGLSTGLLPPGGIAQSTPLSETKIEGFSYTAWELRYGATASQYLNPCHPPGKSTMEGSVTWPEPSGVGVVRGASAFGSTPMSWPQIAGVVRTRARRKGIADGTLTAE